MGKVLVTQTRGNEFGSPEPTNNAGIAECIHGARMREGQAEIDRFPRTPWLTSLSELVSSQVSMRSYLRKQCGGWKDGTVMLRALLLLKKTHVQLPVSMWKVEGN